MRVLHLLSDAEHGGGPHSVLALCSRLRYLGVEPIIAGPSGPMVAAFARESLEYLLWRPRSPLAWPHLRGLIATTKADLLHAHGKPAGLWARLAGPPALYTLHGFHHERWGRGYLALERWLAGRTAALVHVSEAQRREARDFGLRPRLDPVIPNGVDADRLVRAALWRAAARDRLGLGDGQVIGTVARLDPVKRLEILVEALRHLPESWVLCVIGPGDRHPLWCMADQLGVSSRVFLAGPVPDAARVLPAFDVFATASAKEGAPLALLEAMALGLPTVASAIPAHRELLDDDPRALVAPTPEAVAERILALFANPERAETLGAANFHRVRSRYRLATQAEAHAALYERVLAMGAA